MSAITKQKSTSLVSVCQNMTSASEWTGQYDQLKRSVVQKRQEGKQISTNALKQFNTSAGQLDKDLKTMQASAMEYELSASEIARRMLILENLKKQIAQLPVIGSPIVPQAELLQRDSQFNSTFHRSEESKEVSMNPINTSDRGLVQRQQEVMKMQDEMVADIAKGVDRLYDQAVHIGEEAKQHIEILDKLDTQVDAATEGLREEAKHAQDINNQTRVCGLYVCIALEVVACIVLLVFAGMNHNL